jgi:hypothetical protein
MVVNHPSRLAQSFDGTENKTEKVDRKRCDVLGNIGPGDDGHLL